MELTFNEKQMIAEMIADKIAINKTMLQSAKELGYKSSQQAIKKEITELEALYQKIGVEPRPIDCGMVEKFIDAMEKDNPDDARLYN